MKETKQPFATQMEKPELKFVVAEELLSHEPVASSSSSGIVGSEKIDASGNYDLRLAVPVEEVASRSRNAGNEGEINSANDLMNIVVDPNASEHQWLSACNELNQLNEANQANKSIPRSTRKGRAIHFVAASTILVSAIVGAANFLHFGPFASPPVISYQPYMVTIEKEMRSHWHPPHSGTSSKVALHFKIHKNGDLSDVGFDRMSRLSETDAAALKAVIESMPALPPLPPGAPESVDVQFHFDYHVGKGSK